MKSRVIDSIAVLPTLLTLGNAVCGFTSIAYAAEGVANPWRLEHAAWMIFLAMVFDALDGQVARLTRRMTDFGAELDSLCDAISFGVAPAFLTMQMIREMFPSKVVWALGGLYVLCAIMRLARFNVAEENGEKSHRFFVGLPSPAAAGMAASLVLIHFDLEKSLGFSESIALWLLPFVVLFLGPLMISNIRYIHFLNRYFQTRKPFFYLAELVFMAVLAAIRLDVALCLAFTFYMFSGLAGALVNLVRESRARRSGVEYPDAEHRDGVSREP